MFRFGLPRLDFRPSLGSGLVSPRIKKSAGSFPEQRLEIEPMYLPLLETRKGDWSRNASRNCFWDCYRGCPSQVLVNRFPVFYNSPRSLCES